MKVICHHNHPKLPRLEFGIRCHSTSPTAVHHLPHSAKHRVSVIILTMWDSLLLSHLCDVSHFLTSFCSGGLLCESWMKVRTAFKLQIQEVYVATQYGGTLMERSGVNWRQRSQTGMNNMQSSTEQETCFYFSRLRVKRQKKNIN